jgi:hypothetical protein
MSDRGKNPGVRKVTHVKAHGYPGYMVGDDGNFWLVPRDPSALRGPAARRPLATGTGRREELLYRSSLPLPFPSRGEGAGSRERESRTSR